MTLILALILNFSLLSTPSSGESQTQLNTYPNYQQIFTPTISRIETQRQYKVLFELAAAKDKRELALRIAKKLDARKEPPKPAPSHVWRTMRELGSKDLFFLLVDILGREDANNDWVFARCREVQANPDGYLDIWAREHFKSSVITFALSIQDIINDPEITIGIFSFTRPIAKKFLSQIKTELENNAKLKKLWPEIFWQDPKKKAPKWSLDDGITVKRKGNPKEQTVEAWGMTDGQPTSTHFKLRIYDDVITRETVTNPEMIKKVTTAWELSLNLGKAETGKSRYLGTFYHYADTYVEILKRGAAKPRIYPATKDGTIDGEPVLFSRATLRDKIRDGGGATSYTVATQLFCRPEMDKSKDGFDEAWLQYWPASHFGNMNIYILCDPASEKKLSSDYTVFIVIGLGKDRNYYVIDMIRDKLNLSERANTLFQLHQKYSPKRVGYEKYGKDSDIEHYKDRMKRDNYRFHIEPLKGPLAKDARIKRLIPKFLGGMVYLPESCIHSNYMKEVENLTRVFVDTEYKAFPFCEHDDMLDCLARILDEDMQATFPKGDARETFHSRPNTDQVEDYDPLYRS